MHKTDAGWIAAQSTADGPARSSLSSPSCSTPVLMSEAGHAAALPAYHVLGAAGSSEVPRAISGVLTSRAHRAATAAPPRRRKLGDQPDSSNVLATCLARSAAGPDRRRAERAEARFDSGTSRALAGGGRLRAMSRARRLVAERASQEAGSCRGRRATSTIAGVLTSCGTRRAQSRADTERCHRSGYCATAIHLASRPRGVRPAPRSLRSPGR
jgi:hypothetical protein